MSIQWALFSIAIFQGIMLGMIVLRSPIFKSNANKYLAYAVIGLSILLFCLASEVTETYQQPLLLRVLNIFCSGALFPVLILLFIANQVEHSFRHSPERWWCGRNSRIEWHSHIPLHQLIGFGRICRQQATGTADGQHTGAGCRL